MRRAMTALAAGDLRRPGGILLLAVFFALLTGYIEAGVHLFRYNVMHRMVWTTTDILWVAPLAYLGFFLPLGIALAVIARVRANGLPANLSAGVLGFVLALVASVMIIGTRIHWAAHLVLALGAAVQIARIVKTRPERLVKLVNRAAAPLLALTLLMALVVPIGRSMLERRAAGKLTQADERAPNVVLIIWDTVRRTNLSLYGYPRETTPNLQSWANKAIVFDNAESTAPWTLSSHASMFTGHLTQELSPDWDTGLDGAEPTIAEALRDRGYYTAGFVANLLSTQHDSGLNRGFLHYQDYELAGSSFFLSTLIGQRFYKPKPFNRGPIRYYPIKEAWDLTDEFISWLPRAKDKPFFAFLNYIDAHHTFPAPPDLIKKLGGKRRIEKYDAAIGSLDRQLDIVFKELDRRGLRNNTLVILASDHGEQFGEKRLFQHGNSLYQPALVVPLVVWLPGDQHGGQRVGAPVTLRDIARTILDVTGVPQDRFAGSSLARYWTPGVNPGKDTLIAGVQKRMGAPNKDPNSRGDMNAAYTAQHSYILNGDGEEELYDIIADPREDRNLAKDAANGEHLARFRALLQTRVPHSWLTSLSKQKQAVSSAGAAQR